MTTQQVANRYYELASQNKWMELQDQLHDDNVTCREPEHAAARGVQVLTQGKDAVRAKGDANRQMIETIHSQYCSEPLVAGDFLSVVLKRDVSFKNRPRMALEELCIFKVVNGKIVSEQFFY